MLKILISQSLFALLFIFLLYFGVQVCTKNLAPPPVTSVLKPKHKPTPYPKPHNTHLDYDLLTDTWRIKLRTENTIHP